MSEAVAIASVGASAIVALGVPLVNAQLERRRMMLQERRGSLDELRGVLDEGALALSRARAALDDLEVTAERAQAPRSTDNDVATAQVAVRQAATALRSVADQQIRGAVRLGSSAPAALAFARASKALREELTVLESVIGGGPSSADADGWAEVVGVLGEARASFRTHHDVFLDSAASLVGPPPQAS